jgi:hypothetical protein
MLPPGKMCTHVPISVFVQPCQGGGNVRIAKVALEAYDRNGMLLERTPLVGSHQFLSITNPNIYLAKFVSNPATPGNIGIDNVSFELSPFPNRRLLS